MVYANRMKKRLEMGFTVLKMDLGIRLLRNVPGSLTQPANLENYNWTKHPFTGVQITDKGIAYLEEYVEKVREGIGYSVPLAADHFGHIGVNSCIRLGKALERFQMAWLEDLIPWTYTDLWKEITDAIDVPTLTGEDIYLKESFMKLIDAHAVDMVHPDLATAGGIMETKKIGDYAEEHGVAMAMHFAGTPISCMANVHCAAATQNVFALENHAVDVPWWSDLAIGLPNPIIQKGYIEVPNKPGLGVELNEEVAKQHLAEPGFFEPTPEWDHVTSNDRQWS